MANPFSGLENIGQSFLQGMQLAEQRKARQEALAQREEEARIRGQYYQDVVNQRTEAARLAAENKRDILAAKFGEYLTLKPDGEVDLVESARKQKEAEGQDALAETAGLASALGTPIEGVTEKMRGTKAFQRGVASGIVKKIENDIALRRVMASQGIVPAGELPAAVESAVTGGGGGLGYNPMAPGQVEAPMVSPVEEMVAPPGMVPVKMGGQSFMMRKPKAEAAPKPDRPYTVTIRDEEGNPIETIKMTAEEKRAYDAKKAAEAKPAATATNATPVLRITGGPGNRSIQR